jgi:hypothetical protein
MNPTTSATHTFTCTTSSSADLYSQTILIFKAPYFGTMVFDKSCGQNPTQVFDGTYYTASNCASSLSPAVTNELLVSFYGGAGLISMPNLEINNGFVFSAGNINSGGAYLVQPSTTAINPKWFTYDDISSLNSFLVAFKSSTAPATNRRKRVKVIQ